MKKNQTISIILSLTVLSIIFISGCSQSPQKKIQNSVQQAMNAGTTPDNVMTSNSDATTSEKTYTLADVAMHNSKEDCWMIIHDNVYDVTDYVSSHPGGSAILEGCGIDSTNLFETRPMGSGTPHSGGARDKMDEYLIGSVVGE